MSLSSDKIAVVKGFNPFLLTQLEELWPYSNERKNIEKKVTETKAAPEETHLLHLYHLYYTPHWYEEMHRIFALEEKEKSLAISRLYAYSDDGRRIYLQKHLSRGYVFLGRMVAYVPSPSGVAQEKELGHFVVKWVNPILGTGDIEREIKRWVALKKAGADLPLFSTDFSFWGYPVLVMEQLYHIDTSNNEYLVGIAVLRLLKIMYNDTLGVHNDIKPSNIMKSKSGKIHLIDFGGMADEKKHYGFERQVWTPPYAAQVEEYGQVTTYKYDLLELMKTIKALRLIIRPREEKLNLLEGKRSYSEALHDYVCNIAYNDPLYPLLELIRSYPDNAIPLEIYDKLERLLALSVPSDVRLMFEANF